MTSGTPAVLSVDVGTTGVRVAAIDLAGTMRGMRSESIPPAPEIDAEQLWQTVARLLRETTAEAVPVHAVGCAAQLALVLLGIDGRPVRPAMTWMDARAQEQAERLDRIFGHDALVQRCGRGAHPELVAPKLAWVAKHEPEALRRTRAVLTLKDYMVYRLTGRMGTDYVHASYTLLFDIAALQWAEDLIDAVGAAPAWLPPVRWPSEVVGPVMGDAARETGIASGTPVVAGGPDGTVGMVGLGLTSTDEAGDTAGTSDVVFGLVSHPVVDPEGRLVTNAYAVPGRWAVGGPTTTTGGFLEWVAATFGGTPDGLPQLLEEAEAVDSGADGLVALPDLIGARAPHWSAQTRAVFCGLTLRHTRAHLVRAALEATAYVEREILDCIAQVASPPQRVRIGGGGGTHPFWQRIRADVTALPHLASQERYITSLGAAMLAAVGAGSFATVQDAANAMLRPPIEYRPDPASCRRYADAYPTYQAVRRALDGVFASGLSERAAR